MILEFVDKVLVHKPDRSSGERVMEVDVCLRFIGNFQIPTPEPTPEELEARERARKRRAVQRETQRRYEQRKRERERKIAEGKSGDNPDN